MPELTVLGSSPVADVLVTLAPQFHWAVVRELREAPAAGRFRATVIATQGQGDLDALKAALGASSGHVAFVGSTKKFAALSAKLEQAGLPPEDIANVSAPAGLNIGAVTPEEIALSIMAELTQLRRQALPRGDDA